MGNGLAAFGVSFFFLFIGHQHIVLRMGYNAYVPHLSAFFAGRWWRRAAGVV